MRTKMAVATLTVLACTFPALAGAYISEARPEVTVSYGDLDLTSQAGRTTLYNRLESAARKVCGPVSIRMAGSVARIADNKACYRETLNDAVEAVDVPAVTEMHNRNS